MNNDFFENGTFMCGANYWASHAGTHMWRNWDPTVVENDLKLLSENSVNVLRVFPNWEDFQPITAIDGNHGYLVEATHGETFLDKTTEAGRAGISLECFEHFKDFCALAEKYHIKLIVGLITGWMSGRLYQPPILQGKNLLTDPFCIQWEVRFVKYFVKTFKNEPSIIAWELGNECNCLADVETPEQTWVWCNTIADAIKSVDSSRKVVSGMHSLMRPTSGIERQGEICDVLTVHPYFLFTPLCDLDTLVSPRAILHSPAELSMYADLGGRNCLVEEIGSFCSGAGCPEKVAQFVRANLFNSWIHNGLGMIWWCAFDQDHLLFIPYETHETERELGMFRKDMTAKPLAEEYRKFARLLKELPFERLPLRRRDAVCLVDESDWTNCFGAFMLAKRAGLDIQFSSKLNKLPDSKLYIVPGTNNDRNVLRSRTFLPLIERVKNGATVLFTNGDNLPCQMEEAIGCRSLGRYYANAPLRCKLDGKELSIARRYTLRLVAQTADVLAYDENGAPALTCHKLGKGNVLFLNAPIETALAQTPAIASEENGYEAVYAQAMRVAGIQHGVEKHCPLIDVTEHPLDEKRSVVIAMNNTENDQSDTFSLQGVRLEKVVYGNASAAKNGLSICVPAADAVIFLVEKI